MVEAGVDDRGASGGSIDELIAERDAYCRGVLLLGLSAPVERLRRRALSRRRDSATCRGFAVGRTIFEKPSLAWLRGTDR